MTGYQIAVETRARVIASQIDLSDVITYPYIPLLQSLQNKNCIQI